jgi:Tol biopolymer transport system component
VANFAASPSGTIVFQSHRDRSRLAWVDRSGREVAQVGPAADYRNIRISPTGLTVLASRLRASTGTPGLWSIDLARGRDTPLSHDETVAEALPMEIPGTGDVIFGSPEGSGLRVFRRDYATGATRPVMRGTAFQTPMDVSPDGTRLAYEELDADGGADLWSVRLGDPDTATPIRRTPARETGLRFAPDGRHYLFRSSGAEGVYRVFVASLSGGAPLQVSDGSAVLARWSPNGREIVYVSSDRRVVAVSLRTSPTVQIGSPETLFQLGRRWLDFDISADGTRLLAIVPEVVADQEPLTAILHWREPRRQASAVNVGARP